MTDSVSIELDQVVSIKTIGVLKEQLDEVLEKKKDVVLLGNQVEQIDTAGLQLLAAFNEKLKQDGRVMSWDQPSEEICNVVALLGLKEAVSFH